MFKYGAEPPGFFTASKNFLKTASISALLFARPEKCAEGGKNAVALSAKKPVNLSHSRLEKTLIKSVIVAATCAESLFGACANVSVG